ncbi:orotate phosphoribosyltransferase [Nodularia spumigena CS-584]|jgi:orotate phosphoribosyltransferase|uniref:Orotate phosphoribosyltransferase n=2 Tax=Nodularia spumigena TaxID=70799 RepID=A0A2S0Q8N2_NODSP|nr:orotate phosphoribosyltransferase [Nodularia spumigena]AHJ28883.1 Orotate phosphoribosyltransferase [Nodularia spumigena CCY9414]AVZ30809.1 orotate phosphoribosyltransferase [Nodularia spumigena UHCC 0039]EAW45128.1 orotate phosphoribosyltransferase [Nodularia spumigena CCY9414]MDB9320094.1 orotate phosphoribosyltransferase [Nodularia spumigena CS-590/01A]MDB9325881.1 orotate phosphoribosyltransferase [Nodularia spumigena CS-590/02]
MTYTTETFTQSDSAATTDLTTLHDKLLNLFCQLAYQEGDFVLSSGQSSSYYINGKQVTLHPQGALAIGRILLSLLPTETQAVAGLTLGADPIVSAVSVVSAYENRPIPALIIRKEAKGHGTRAYIEGPNLPEGAKVIVLEDVVTTGKSAMTAVERLREAGYTVDTVITLVDRLQGGAEFYQSVGLNFKTVFTIADLQKRYQQLAN